MIYMFLDAEVTQGSGYGFVGSSVTLTAKVTANEEASNVVWYKNGGRMAEVSFQANFLFFTLKLQYIVINV